MIRIDAVPEDDSETANAIAALLKAYNRRFTTYDYAAFAFAARDASGSVVGGAMGHTGWGWCYLDRLVIGEGARGQGFGRRLLETVEMHARSRGCVGVHLWTAGFQAPAFYPKFGYREFGRLDDNPPGHTTILFRKRFDEGSATV